MRILAAAAVLLGLATAKTNLKSMTGTYSTATGIVDPSFTWTFALDYQTVYGTGQDSTSDWILYESYGINAASSVSADFGLDFFGAYTYTLTLDLTLFDVTPYTQYIQWVNPVAILTGAATGFDIGFKGEYDLEFLEFEVTHTQEFLTLAYDVADWIETTAAGTTTVADLVPTTSDWSLSDSDFTSAIFEFSPSTYLGAWYGTNTYYQTSITGYITANV